MLVVLGLRWINPPGSAFIYSYNLDNNPDTTIIWTDLENISPWLQMSVIAAEDQKFPFHWGFDFASIEKAINEDRQRKRGASTISQQLTKNLLLWKGRSYFRKALEVWFTFLIECLWPKERILEVYLNIIEFGPGIYGAEKAARRYFQLSANDINPFQAGLMAAVLPNPNRMSLAQPSDYVQKRAFEIYQQVQLLGGTDFLKTLH